MSGEEVTVTSMTENESSQWYSNKDLFERLGVLRDDFTELRIEMKETRNLIKNYNGLREEVKDVKDGYSEMKTMAQNYKDVKKEIEIIGEDYVEIKTMVQNLISEGRGKNTTLENIRNWGGWIIALITFFILVYKQIS